MIFQVTWCEGSESETGCRYLNVGYSELTFDENLLQVAGSLIEHYGMIGQY